MTIDRTTLAADAVESAGLVLALEQSHEVRDKVAAVADDLASTNEVVKQQIADGVTVLPAEATLADSESVEDRVKECVDDLHEVNATLAQGIDDLQQTEIALMRSRAALAVTEYALVTALEGERKARALAQHDTATGLANRDLFDSRLAHAISMAERHLWTLAVMFFDLDSFKSINDTHGHAAGDQVLKEVARRLSQHCRDEDTVCRTGGDEFIYLFMNPQGRDNVERLASVVMATIALPVAVGDLTLTTRASIGIALYPDHGTSGDELVRNADAAMYRAKKRNGGYVFFDAPGADRMSS